MAMTKAEKAEMDRLRNDLALARSLRWPDYPVPAAMTYGEIKAELVEGGVSDYGRGPQRQMVARGWFWHAYLGGHTPYSVTYGCSNGISHSRAGDVTTTQEMGRMYRTKLEAFQAARLAMTETCAKSLAAIDQEIDHLRQNPIRGEAA